MLYILTLPRLNVSMLVPLPFTINRALPLIFGRSIHHTKVTNLLEASVDRRHNGHKEIDKHLIQFLDRIDDDLERNGLGNYSKAYEAMYKATMRDGVNALSGTLSIANNQAWDDAMAYAREVIVAPDDSTARASTPWVRSCSALNQALITRFGPETIEAARLGTASIIKNNYADNRLAIAHVDKKASFLRHCRDTKVGAAFYPPSNPLAVSCYQCCAFPFGLAMSAFLPTEKAVQAGFIAGAAVCDDLGSFTEADYDVRMRMVAMTAGVAYQFGGQVINALVDGTAKQVVGTGDGTLRPIEAAMAWRAVSGCTTVYSECNFNCSSVEEGMVAPTVMVAVHDLLDWRCDVAAGNHENCLSAVCGFGVAAPFHSFVKALLRETLLSPRSGLYGIAATVYMHFTVGRYGAWEYHGEKGRVCQECIELLAQATEAAGLQWAPKPPPDSYAAGEKYREWSKLWSDHFVDNLLIQEGASWFQFLISSGKIWNFDVMAQGVQAVDKDADWA